MSAIPNPPRDHPLDYSPSMLPANAENVFRPAHRRMVIAFILVELFIIGALGLLPLIQYYSGGPSSGVRYFLRFWIVMSVLSSAVLVLTGLGMLMYRWPYRWAIRRDGLLIVRGVHILDVIPWDNIREIEVKWTGTGLTLIKHAWWSQKTTWLPIARGDGNRMREAWLAYRQYDGTTA